MNIALFTDSDAFAGTERHMLELADGLRGEGLRPAMVCPAKSPLATLAGRGGHQVIEIEKRRLIDWRAIKTLRRLLRDGELDVIHAHNGRTHLIAALAAVTARRGAVVTTQHFISPTRVGRRGIRGKISRTLHRWASRRTQGLIAISTAVSSAVVGRDDFPTDRVAVVPNGIAAPDVSLVPASDVVRKTFGLSPQTPLIVCAARLEPEKDIDVLISAMRQVLRTHPDAVCLIAGSGSQRDELELQIRTAGLSSSVRLLGHRRDVLALIHAADIFVLASHAEPFGLVLLEAMSLSRPVIAVAAGGPAEIVMDQATGLLVPPRDADKLAGAIIQLMQNAPAREAIGKSGLQRYETCFTAARMARDTAAVYRRAVELREGSQGLPAISDYSYERREEVEPCAMP